MNFKSIALWTFAITKGVWFTKSNMASSLDAALFGDVPTTVTRSVSRLQLEDEDRLLYTLTEYDGSTLKITITDGGQAWNGQVTARDLSSLAKDVKMPVDEFTAETLKALTRENMGPLTCVYSTKPARGGGLQLSWKRHMKEEGIKFELGSVILSPQALQTANCSILNYAVETIGSLKDEIAELQRGKSLLITERRGALSRLEDCAKLKENLEKDLYGKFRLILNDKKGKIRRLMDQLSHLSEQNRQLQLSESHGNTPLVADEDDPSVNHANETDDEMDPTPNSKVSVELDSLLDEHKETVALPVVKRRRREPRASSRSTEIPRPPTLKSPEVSERSSNRSTDLEESLESDKLLGLL